MKLIAQIPCYNEEATMAFDVACIPRSIPGISKVEIQIMDDGSTDRTVEIARLCGVDHIVQNGRNNRLARSFQKGIESALALGADIVVGERKPGDNPQFSWLNRQMQKLGTRVVRNLSGINVGDAVSGFRAYTREAAFTIKVMTRFIYTTETLIHAGQLRFFQVNEQTKPVWTMDQCRLLTENKGFSKADTLRICQPPRIGG